jgi:hypothetical protein
MRSHRKVPVLEPTYRGVVEVLAVLGVAVELLLLLRPAAEDRPAGVAVREAVMENLHSIQNREYLVVLLFRCSMLFFHDIPSTK